MGKIKTAGDLREFLCDVIVGVQAGKIQPETARNISRLSSQVNESFYSEIKAQKIAIESGKQVPALGDLAINK